MMVVEGVEREQEPLELENAKRELGEADNSDEVALLKATWKVAPTAPHESEGPLTRPPAGDDAIDS